MEKIILCLFILICSLNCLSQYPIVEEFNAGSTWTYTNGAGMQNYGGSENYGSTNIGGTPYLNSSTITITSPILNLSNCSVNVNVSFPLSGIIENGFDFMYFEYYNGSIWIIVATFTGNQNSTSSYSIPNTATRFRFRTVTDASSIVWYKPDLTNPRATPNASHTVPVDISNSFVFNVPPRAVLVYYYDITSFTIDCPIPMPVELISFTGKFKNDYNILEWITASEINNDFFTIESSSDAINFNEVGRINGAGNSAEYHFYEIKDFNFYDLTYYKLSQTDYDGNHEIFGLITVARAHTNDNLEVVKIVNLLGQEVPIDYNGIQIITFSNGTVVKKCVIK